MCVRKMKDVALDAATLTYLRDRKLGSGWSSPRDFCWASWAVTDSLGLASFLASCLVGLPACHVGY